MDSVLFRPPPFSLSSSSASSLILPGQHGQQQQQSSQQPQPQPHRRTPLEPLEQLALPHALPPHAVQLLARRSSTQALQLSLAGLPGRYHHPLVQPPRNPRRAMSGPQSFPHASDEELAELQKLSNAYQPDVSVRAPRR